MNAINWTVIFTNCTISAEVEEAATTQVDPAKRKSLVLPPSKSS